MPVVREHQHGHCHELKQLEYTSDSDVGITLILFCKRVVHNYS